MLYRVILQLQKEKKQKDKKLTKKIIPPKRLINDNKNNTNKITKDYPEEKIIEALRNRKTLEPKIV